MHVETWLSLIASSESDVSLYLTAGRLDAVREASDLENGLFVARWRHDVGVSLLLDVLDGGAFGTYHKTYYSIRNSHLDGDLSGDVGGRSGGRSFAG